MHDPVPPGRHSFRSEIECQFSRKVQSENQPGFEPSRFCNDFDRCMCNHVSDGICPSTETLDKLKFVSKRRARALTGLIAAMEARGRFTGSREEKGYGRFFYFAEYSAVYTDCGGCDAGRGTLWSPHRCWSRSTGRRSTGSTCSVGIRQTATILYRQRRAKRLIGAFSGSWQ